MCLSFFKKSLFIPRKKKKKQIKDRLSSDFNKLNCKHHQRDTHTRTHTFDFLNAEKVNWWIDILLLFLTTSNLTYIVRAYGKYENKSCVQANTKKKSQSEKLTNNFFTIRKMFCVLFLFVFQRALSCSCTPLT